MITKITIFKSTKISIVWPETKKCKETHTGKRNVRINIITKMTISKYENIECFGETKKCKDTHSGKRNVRNSMITKKKQSKVRKYGLLWGKLKLRK